MTILMNVNTLPLSLSDFPTFTSLFFPLSKYLGFFFQCGCKWVDSKLEILGSNLVITYNENTDQVAYFLII